MTPLSRGLVLAVALFLLSSAVALQTPGPTPATAPAFGPAPLKQALDARLAECSADARCRAETAAAFGSEIGTRLQAIPPGRAGVLASVTEALRDGGYPVPAPSGATSSDLPAAILRLHRAIGHPVDPAATLTLRRDAAAVPGDVARALVPLVDAVTDAHLASRGILSPAELRVLTADPVLTARLVTLVGSAPEGSVDPRLAALWAERAEALRHVDRAALAQAAVDLAAAVSAFPLASAAPTGAPCAAKLFTFPFIEVGDACDDTYTALNLVQVDLGGNDRYLNNAGSGLVGVGAGVSLDLGPGNDTYRAPGQSQGFGLAGVGILYDEGGADRYNLTNFGQGAGVAGLGLLYDAGTANDTYESPHANDSVSTKASGLAGIGILVDEGGDDKYQQDGLDGFAYGAANGIGILLDRGNGKDNYTARDLPIILAAGGIIDENLGNFTGPIQVSAEVGGTAILLDEGGDDLYRCGDHVRQGCQAAAGGAAFALLLDRAGNDRYLAGVSMSTHLSEAGIPLAIPIFSMGQGSAYGPSAGPGTALLLDQGGDDTYQAEKWAQGFGTAGLGLLVDEAGHDRYSILTATAGNRADGQAWVDGSGLGLDLT